MANNVIDAAIRLRDLFTPTVKSVNASLDTMKTQMAAAKQSVSGLSGKLTEHERIQKRTAKSIEQTGGKISGLLDKFALLSAPILAVATAGFKLNSDFTNGLAKVSTLVDTTVVSMDKIKEEIRSVSDETGAGVADLSESVYQAISAGVDAGHAVSFVKDMTIAAKAGFTDTTTAVNGVTTVLNAYGKSAEEASHITDQMLLAQNFGKTSFGEMAQSMGNVIPIASQLNVTTQELFGSIAVLTKNGIATSEAITGLKAAYSNILKPSSEAAKLAQSLGLEFNAAHLQSVGWVKFLDEVKRATGGDAEQMAQLFSSVEGLNSILVLTGKGAGDFDKVMKQMADSAGMTQEAYEKMLTPSEQMQIAMNQLKNAGMDLAVSFTPYFKAMSLRVKELAAWFRSLTPEQKALIGQVAFGIVAFQMFGSTLGRILTVGGKAYGTFTSIATGISKAGSVSKYLSAQFKGIIPVVKGIGLVAKGLGSTFLSVGKLVITVIRAVGAAAMANPILLVIAAIIAGLYLLWSNWDTVSQYIEGAVQAVSEAVDAGMQRLTSAWDGAMESIGSTASGIWESIKGTFRSGVNWVMDQVNGLISSINGLSIDIPSLTGGTPTHVGFNIEPISHFAKGVENFGGGFAVINEDRRGELVHLPNGSTVVPHDESIRQAMSAGGHSITIRIDTMNVRSEQDIDAIADKLVEKIRLYGMNRMKGATI
ncbi:phage tail tape measure protein [Megasphaera hominis]|uniref:Phage tail tape measure protein n=1 Tax=Megasphaera hominis TaxID=159836 RepID=A0ABR6VER6_9FIRM|nr:phage tail tape measure protein [Megasphaera hominis]MBC3535727.1 phage tail tape measure protein [Megasphaera hominis]